MYLYSVSERAPVSPDATMSRCKKVEKSGGAAVEVAEEVEETEVRFCGP